MKTDRQEDPFVLRVRRQAERAHRRKRPSLWMGFGVVGWVGWMVVLPALAGIALGRYLDVRFGAGIFWTLSLLVLGLALGCAAAWRQMREALKE